MPDVGLLKVVAVFFVTYLGMQLLTWWLAIRGVLHPLTEATAELTGACANLTGVPATVLGNKIFLATRILSIDLDCTGVALMTVYAALVLAYPVGWRRKSVGLLVGLAAIGVANAARLVAVAHLSGPLDDRVFTFVHDYLFKVGIVAVVIAAWGLYLASARRHATEG